MQTHFTPQQLQSPAISEANAILRSCVHCGFCLSTCPTYRILGDELDSPRGRIYLVKGMLETGVPATSGVVKHLDRCLSCLACMTACPSGVDYMHLIDQARVHVEATYRRPPGDRLLRALLAFILPEPRRLGLVLLLARLVRPIRGLLGLVPPLKAMLELAPQTLPPSEPLQEPGIHRATASRRGRVILLTGCVQTIVDPSINAATVRLLNRAGYDVSIPPAMGCCGSLTHHMGKERDARARARANILAWTAEIERERVDAIIVNASGCGTTVKDYGHMFAGDLDLGTRAAQVSTLARDVSEFLAEIGIDGSPPRGLRVAYHSACALQHGQRITAEPRALLARAGFEVLEIENGHICCGSAGTYNILQPDLARMLRDEKVKSIEATRPDVIATGNIGCLRQIASGTSIPVVHTVELLDWATGGPSPLELR